MTAKDGRATVTMKGLLIGSVALMVVGFGAMAWGMRQRAATCC